MPIKVLMSTLGRSHFITAADSIVRNGVDLRLFQGWVPEDINSIAVRVAARIIGRSSFVAGLAKRKTEALNGRVISSPWGELLQTFFLMTIGRLADWCRGWGVTASFNLHGFCSRRFLRGNDIFHVKSGLGRGGAIWCAKRLGLKVIVDQGIAHPVYMERILKPEYQRMGLRYHTEKFWGAVLKDCRAADLLQVNSQFVKDTFVEQGYDADKIRVVSLGVRQDFNKICRYQYVNNPKCLHLLFTGAFNVRKGAEYVLETVRLLCERGVKCHLTIVGSLGVEGRALMDRAEGNSLPVQFVGHIPQDELAFYLSDSDIYIFPSLSEGCAQSGMEALSAGLCVVATVQSGLPIVDGVDGLVVPEKDSHAMADCIMKLVEEPERIREIGMNASRKLAQYTWENYARNVCRVYEEILKGSTGKFVV